MHWWDHAWTTIPESDESIEVALKLGLLVSLVGDVLDVFLEVEQRSVEKLLQVESVAVVRDIVLAHLDDLLPMSVLDCWFSKGLDHTGDLIIVTTNELLHVLDLFFELLESIPLLELSWELLAVSVEDIDSLLHLVDLILDFDPGDVLPLSDGVLDL